MNKTCDIGIYLDSIDLTPIAHIIRMHCEQEDDRLEYGLAGVPENKCDEDELRTEKEQELACCYPQDEKPDDQYDNAYYDVDDPMQLVNRSLRVV